VRLPRPAILLVTDRRQARRPLAEVVEDALAAGCRWVSVREKDLPAAEQIVLVQTLLPLASRYNACVCVHGEATLAKEANADGLHLSAGSDCRAARNLLGAEKLIGVSIHTKTEAQTIDPGVVDYAIAGPMFETSSKPGYGPAFGRKGLAQIVNATRIPILAIGGISPARAADVVAAGAIGVAVMGSVMRAADGREIEALLAALRKRV
jgi:thiamine-phosphate pyrophosphorylase